MSQGSYLAVLGCLARSCFWVWNLKSYWIFARFFCMTFSMCLIKIWDAHHTQQRCSWALFMLLGSVLCRTLYLKPCYVLLYALCCTISGASLYRSDLGSYLMMRPLYWMKMVLKADPLCYYDLSFDSVLTDLFATGIVFFMSAILFTVHLGRPCSWYINWSSIFHTWL